MKLEIDFDRLPVEQARELARHWCELLEVIAAADDRLIESIRAVFADDGKTDEPRIALIAASLTFNSWSKFLNGATDASNAEVRRILGIESSPSTLQ